MDSEMTAMTKRLLGLATAPLFLAIIAANANGAAVLSDDFGYPDGNLAGQGSWTAYTAGTAAVQLSSGTVAEVPAATGSTLEIARRPLSQTFNTAGTSLFYGIDINVSATSTSGDWLMGLSSTGGSYGAKLNIKSSGSGYVLGWNVGSGNSTAQYGSTVLSYNTPVRVVMRYDFVSGATNDAGAIYVNPTDASDVSLNTAYYTTTTFATTQADVSTVAAFNLHKGGTSGPSMTIDNLVVGGWSDVSAVPEPTSLALLALGSVAMLRRRNRKA